MGTQDTNRSTETQSISAETAAEVVETLATAANTGVDQDVLTETLVDEHRYLQNEIFFGMLKPMIIALGTTSQHDARNEDAVKASREIVDAMNWD